MKIEFYKEIDRAMDTLLVNIKTTLSSPTQEYAKQRGSVLMRLKQTQRKVLGALYAKGDSCIKDLAFVAEITCKNIAAPIRELEQLGYVEKCSNPQDSRYVIVKLTEIGRELCEKESQIVLEGYMSIFYNEHFTDEQQMRILELANQLNAMLDKAKSE
ncbi:MAG: MarR family winged helix-turn-helix transcriptional regulator [Clostridia bacterium]|nr:MarR family winged helix-turn-helix transcriptional regulator [Clostridia bacterium]